MVLQRIVREIISRGVRYSRYEDKIWKGLYGPHGRYPGVSNYKYAARGIKHGLASGGAIGQFINEDGKGTGSGSLFQNETNKSYKTRGRYSNRRSGKYSSRKSCRCKRKYKYTRVRSRGRNRFYR